MTQRRLFALLLLLLVGLSAAACGGSSRATDDEPGAAVVERVVDGDTLRVRVGGHSESVRLIGIDTPESVRPGTPVQCFAKEAGARLRALAAPGTQIHLERDVEARDRYGRLLAYVFRRRDGLFVNLSLAREGYAQVATYPPNVTHTADFTAAVAEARDAGLGLWSHCPVSRSGP